MPEGRYKAVAAVATALWAVTHRKQNCKNGSQSRGYRAAFTLVELSVTMGVLVLLVFLFTQLLNSAANITILGHKQMDADSEARQVLDRMAVDFAQMVKRSDVDYFAKGTAAPNSIGGTMNGNDQIAYYSTVPGYYPTSSYQSPISLIAYRINQDTTAGNPAYLKLQRMGKGFTWNGAAPSYTPILFFNNTSATTISANWPAAVDGSATDPDYETIGPQVFRFEYYYLLKGEGTTYAPVVTDTPWDTRIGHTSVSGMQDVAAIIVDIAVIDPKSKVLLTDAQMATLAGQLIDHSPTMGPGDLFGWDTNNGDPADGWQTALNKSTLPRPAISGIRVYERYFYLNQ